MKESSGVVQYLVETLAYLSGSVAVLVALFRSTRFSRLFMRAFGGMQSLNEIIENSKFAADTGLAFIDPNGRIVTATQVLVELSRDKSLKGMVDRRFHRVYPDTLSRLLTELIDKARSTKQVAVVSIPDWSQYCAAQLGSAVLYVTPAFDGCKYIGAIIVVRSTEDVRTAEDSSIYYQMHYQILFDSLPIGAAVFRPAIAADGGADAYIVTANPALKKAVDGLPLPFNEPCSVAWPSFMQQTALRTAMADAATSGTPVRAEFFSPAIGKSLEVYLTQLPAGRILCMLIDQTEQRMSEQKVLALNDQLQRTLAGQSHYVHAVLEDIQHFNQAIADIVETHLESIRTVIAKVPAKDAEELSVASSGLYQSLNQMLRYHNVANLPFKDSALVYPSEVVARLLEPLGNRFPAISFSIAALPGVVASREILASIVEQLMVSLAQLPVETAPGRIEVGSQQDFTATSITVSGWGFDTSSIFIEIPPEKQPLDWTLTSDLDLAPVRQMITKHGGQLYIAPTPDGLGVELSFSVGSPTL